MNRSLLAACAAARAAASCTESPTASAPPSRTERRRPAPAPAPRETADSSFVDGGELTRAESTPVEPDALALGHEHRGKLDHLGRARQMKTEGDAAGALAEARRAVFDNPGDEEALGLCARLARRTGQLDLAAAAYGRLGVLRTDDATPLVARARVLLAQKDYEQAALVGSSAVDRDGQNPEAFQVVGLAYLAAGDLKSAIAMFERVIALSPEHGWAQNNLGFALLRTNQDERAVELLSRAAELLPNAAAVQNNLGVALERVGRVDEAKAAYAKSTSLSPKYVKAKVNSARVAKATVTPDRVEPAAAAPEAPIAPDLELPED